MSVFFNIAIILLYYQLLFSNIFVSSGSYFNYVLNDHLFILYFCCSFYFMSVFYLKQSITIVVSSLFSVFSYYCFTQVDTLTVAYSTFEISQKKYLSFSIFNIFYQLFPEAILLPCWVVLVRIKASKESKVMYKAF